jgi:hypothetical protein
MQQADILLSIYLSRCSPPPKRPRTASTPSMCHGSWSDRSRKGTYVLTVATGCIQLEWRDPGWSLRYRPRIHVGHPDNKAHSSALETCTSSGPTLRGKDGSRNTSLKGHRRTWNAPTYSEAIRFKHRTCDWMEMIKDYGREPPLTGW